MNSSSSQKTYMKMQGMLLDSEQNRCMLVEVIAKNSQNIPWQISIDGVSRKHNFIRKVSIDKFYEIVTGDSDAFKLLCQVLPKVLDDILKAKEKEHIENSVFKELNDISPNLLNSIYMLSFSKYNGFNNFTL